MSNSRDDWLALRKSFHLPYVEFLGGDAPPNVIIAIDTRHDPADGRLIHAPTGEGRYYDVKTVPEVGAHRRFVLC